LNEYRINSLAPVTDSSVVYFFWLDLAGKNSSSSSSSLFGSLSPSLWGAHAFEAFGAFQTRDRIRAPIEVGQPAIVPREHIRTDFRSERELVAYLTPFLRQVFPDMAFVNGEEFKWLLPFAPAKPSLRNALKPDTFWIPACFYSRRSRPLCNASDPDDFLFGVPSHMCLLESVRIATCKCQLSNQAVGELMSYLIVSSHHLDGRPVRGMVYDSTACIVMEASCNSPMRPVSQMIEIPLAQVCR